MTSSESRAQIYEHLKDRIEIPDKVLSKLLKRNGDVKAAEVLSQLKNRLTQAIESGEEAVKKNDKNKVNYQYQVMTLQSIMKWVDGQLTNLNR
jgi:hypothetical protein